MGGKPFWIVMIVVAVLGFIGLRLLTESFADSVTRGVPVQTE